jgi:hypothetical protein
VHQVDVTTRARTIPLSAPEGDRASDKANPAEMAPSISGFIAKPDHHSRSGSAPGWPR